MVNGHMEGLSLQGMTVHGAHGVQGAVQNSENPAEPAQKPRRVSFVLHPVSWALFFYFFGLVFLIS